MNVNKAMICGRLTRDPELRTTSAGQDVCTLSVAVTDGYKEKAETIYWKAEVWGPAARSCQQHLVKGQQVFAEGSPRLETWEKRDGSGTGAGLVLRFATVQFGARPRDQQDGNADSYGGQSAPTSQRRAAPPPPRADDYAPPANNNDDLPF